MAADSSDQVLAASSSPRENVVLRLTSAPRSPIAQLGLLAGTGADSFQAADSSQVLASSPRDVAVLHQASTPRSPIAPVDLLADSGADSSQVLASAPRDPAALHQASPPRSPIAQLDRLADSGADSFQELLWVPVPPHECEDEQNPEELRQQQNVEEQDQMPRQGDLTPPMRINVGQLPAPFWLDCVASSGLQGSDLLKVPAEERRIEASCLHAELRVGCLLQPTAFWSTLLPRSAECDDAQPAVAPEHFELTMENEGMLLKNLSNAGTLVNGLRIYDEARVQPGDIIGMGAPAAASNGGLLSFRLGSFDCDPAAVAQEPTAGEGFDRADRYDPMLEDLAMIRASAATGPERLYPLDLINLDSQVAPLAVQRCAAEACAIS